MIKKTLTVKHLIKGTGGTERPVEVAIPYIEGLTELNSSRGSAFYLTDDRGIRVQYTYTQNDIVNQNVSNAGFNLKEGLPAKLMSFNILGNAGWVGTAYHVPLVDYAKPSILTSFNTSLWYKTFKDYMWAEIPLTSTDELTKDWTLQFTSASGDKYRLTYTVRLYNSKRNCTISFKLTKDDGTAIGSYTTSGGQALAFLNQASSINVKDLSTLYILPVCVKLDSGIGLQWLVMGIDMCQDNDNTYNRAYPHFATLGLELRSFYEFLDLELTFDDVDDNKFNGNSSSTYYGGSFDNSCDSIGELDIPSFNVLTNSGYHVYKNPNLAPILAHIYTDLDLPDDVTTIDALTELWKASVSNLFITSSKNAIQSLRILPVNVEGSGTNLVKLGSLDIEADAIEISSQYVKVDCGSLELSEYFGSYMDYTLTSMSLYLPFIGYVPIKPENVYTGYLKVVYIFNVLDGSFIAQVLTQTPKSNDTLTTIGYYSGQASVDVPIGGLTVPTREQMASNLVNTGFNVLAMSANPTAATLNLARELNPTNLASGLNNSVDVMSNGSLSSGTAMLGQRTPFLQIYRCKTAIPSSYGSDKGYASSLTVSLNELSGLSQISNIHLDGIVATETEKAEILSLLREGVVF